MGRHDDAVQLEQRRRRARLHGEHIERGAGDLPIADGERQSILVDDAAPSGVDDAQTGLGPRQQVLAHEPDRVGGLGQVDGEEVGHAHELVEAHQLDAHLLRGSAETNGS